MLSSDCCSSNLQLNGLCPQPLFEKRGDGLKNPPVFILCEPSNCRDDECAARSKQLPWPRIPLISQSALLEVRIIDANCKRIAVRVAGHLAQNHVAVSDRRKKDGRPAL